MAGILLAAGAATRMGRNKLLLEIEGESLLRRAARRAVEAGLDPVVVVLGHEPDRARVELAGIRCSAVVNPDHAGGIGSSLSAGVEAVPPEAPAAVVLLADMPLVDAGMIRAVVARYREAGAPIVTSRYGQVTAPPTLYDRTLFPELRKGKRAGREVVRRHRQRVEHVDWPASALADVDVPEDLERARARLGGPGA